jgi:hypothetical protein
MIEPIRVIPPARNPKTNGGIGPKRAALEGLLAADRPNMSSARVLLQEIQALKIRLQEAGNGRGRN